MSRHSLASGILLALAALSAPAARAETLACTAITSLPATITTSGVYCLQQDLGSSATGNLITVAASNVTIDCNDHKIGGLSAGTEVINTAIHGGVVNNVTVRNCTIRGFFTGIELNGAGNVVEGNRIEAARSTGIHIQGWHSTVRDNRIYDTGFYAADTYHYGISADGPNFIVDNTIDAVVAPDESDDSVTGIRLSDGTGGAVIGNRVRGLIASGSGVAYGILTPFSDGLSVRDNTVVATGGLQGIDCDDGGIASGNHVAGFFYPIDDCVDGGNNLTP